MKLASSKRGMSAAVVIAAAAMTLTGCGSVHPGAAAVVDGRQISRATVDETAAAYCTLGLVIAEQQGVQAVATADARRQVVSDLVNFEVAQNLAAEQGIRLDASDYTLTRAEKSDLQETFGADASSVEDVVQRSKRTGALATALGEQRLDVTVNEDNAEEVDAAGVKAVAEALEQADVDIDQRFGLDDTTQPVRQSGSLSAPTEELAATDPADLSAGQRCS